MVQWYKNPRWTTIFIVFIFIFIMATNLIFVSGKKKNTENPILDGCRFVLDRKRNDSSYWKCALFRGGCRARMTTVDKQLTSPVPVHTNHDVEQAYSTVYQRKEELKRKAVDTDLPTKRLVADAVSGISFEARGKMNCHISSLARMARRTRQAADKHPCNPRDLEHLCIPGDYVISHNNKCMMLWDSGYRLPLFYGLLPGKTTTLYKNLFEEVDSWGPYQPSSILLDYELAIHNAVAEVWPSTTRRGCNFHFKQSLLKHLRQ